MNLFYNCKSKQKNEHDKYVLIKNTFFLNLRMWDNTKTKNFS